MYNEKCEKEWLRNRRDVITLIVVATKPQIKPNYGETRKTNEKFVMTLIFCQPSLIVKA